MDTGRNVSSGRRAARAERQKSPPPRKRAQTEKQPRPKRIPQNAAENRCSRRPMVAPTFINGSAIGSVGRALPARKAPLDCIKGPRSGGAGVNDMPVACQSRAPECPQAFGAQRLRGLRPSVVDNPSVTASPCHLPLHKGGFARCGGISPPVCAARRQPPLPRGGLWAEQSLY